MIEDLDPTKMKGLSLHASSQGVVRLSGQPVGGDSPSSAVFTLPGGRNSWVYEVLIKCIL